MSRLIRCAFAATLLGVLTACTTIVDESGKSHKVVADSSVFKGTMTQSDGRTFPIEFQGVNPTRVNYPTLGCRGSLTLVTRTMNEVTFRENIEQGECVDGATIKSSMSGKNIVNMKWSKDGSPLTATAVLYRNGEGQQRQAGRIGGSALPASLPTDQMNVAMKFGTPSEPYTESGTAGMLGVKVADYTETYIDIPVSISMSLADNQVSEAIKSQGKSVFSTVVFGVRDTQRDAIDYINLPGNGTRCHQNVMVLSKSNGYSAKYDFKYKFAIRSDINSRIIVDSKLNNRETRNIDEFYQVTKIGYKPFEIGKHEGRAVTCLGNMDKKTWFAK